MCQYVKGNKCNVTKELCPYMYFCNKTLTWKESKNMPEKCKIQEKYEIPKGKYKVVFEKKGKLYININDNIVIADNIFPIDSIPEYVKAYKNRQGGFIIKK